MSQQTASSMPMIQHDPRIVDAGDRVICITFSTTREGVVSNLKELMKENGAFYIEEKNIPAYPKIKSWSRCFLVIPVEDYLETENQDEISEIMFNHIKDIIGKKVHLSERSQGGFFGSVEFLRRKS